MSIVRGKLVSLSDFKKLMERILVPSIFASVESGSNNQIMCLDADRNIMMEFADTNSSKGYYRIYRNKNNFVDVSVVNRVILDAQYIGCENGIIVSGQVSDGSGYAKYMHFIITKTNNNKPAFIGAFSTNNSHTYDIPMYHIAYGDNVDINSTTTPRYETGTQTILEVFGTNPEIGVKSVTPKAFMIVRDTAYAVNYGTFVLDGVEYITNGYFAINTATD